MDLLPLEDALTKLAKLDPRQARMIELRFFGGLDIAEVAEGDGDIQTIGGAGMDHGPCLVAARTRRERPAMSSERYAQVRRLFLAACELAESEMGAFLDRACAGDPKLREELESLLKQPRTTTIIGTSSEDAARGKVLSPLARSSAGTCSRGTRSCRYPPRGGTG